MEKDSKIWNNYKNGVLKACFLMLKLFIIISNYTLKNTKQTFYVTIKILLNIIILFYRKMIIIICN